MDSLRIVLMGKDFELRVVSLITRSRELAEEVLLLDVGSSDATIELAKKVDCNVMEFTGEMFVPNIAKQLNSHNEEFTTLVVNVDSRLKLRDIPLLVNRAKENWDIHMSFINSNDNKLECTVTATPTKNKLIVKFNDEITISTFKVFLYGKKVNDFHTLDKAKLFALIKLC